MTATNAAATPGANDPRCNDAHNTTAANHTYRVEHGDTLSEIAARRGVSLRALQAANPQIDNPDLIYPGDQLNVPQAEEYVVQPGDTLSAIAARFDTTVEALVALNNISDPDLIYPGDVLQIPADCTPEPPPGTPPTEPGEPVDYETIAGVAGNDNVSPEFIDEVEAIAGRLGTRPEHLLAVMSFETGETFSPSVSNPVSGATGLIQFTGPTAEGLGTSLEELASMTAIEQLAFVEDYYTPYAGQLDTLEAAYTTVLAGNPIPNAEDTLVTPAGNEFTRGNIEYTQNAGLDFNGDGSITAGEATSAVAFKLFGGVDNVQQGLVDAGVVPASEQDGFVDDIFGPMTSAALARFQQQAELPATGLMNEATGRALATAGPGEGGGTPPTGADLQLSQPIHERSTPARQTITSPVIGEFIVTEGFMARGGPHSDKRATQAIFSDNPTVAEHIPAGVYNLGIDYVTSSGRIQNWFDGEVSQVISSNTGYGNRLIMQSDQTFTFQGREYPVFAHYAHADSFNVREGDRIQAGQDIGDQGSTGHSTGDHVDFLSWIELDNGQRVHISPNILANGG